MNIGFLESKKNIIIDGKFTKIIYGDSYLTLNGIFFNFPIFLSGINSPSTLKIINDNTLTKHSNSMLDINAHLKPENFLFDANPNNNKNNILFNVNNPYNINIIKLVTEIETKLIEHYKCEFGINKKTNSPLFKQLVSGKIKLYKECILNSCHHKSASDPNIHKDMYNIPINLSYNAIDHYNNNNNKCIQYEKIIHNIVKDATHSVTARNLKNNRPPGFSQIDEFNIYSPINKIENFNNNSYNSYHHNSKSIDPNILSINLKKSPMIILKISGIWETINEIGITYKFLDMYDI